MVDRLAVGIAKNIKSVRPWDRQRVHLRRVLPSKLPVLFWNALLLKFGPKGTRVNLRWCVHRGEIRLHPPRTDRGSGVFRATASGLLSARHNAGFPGLLEPTSNKW